MHAFDVVEIFLVKEVLDPVVAIDNFEFNLSLALLIELIVG